MNHKQLASKQNFQHIKHLREFFSPQQSIFQDAIDLPEFFLTNLVDDARVVKCFINDPQANIKVFSYQYLKLCFQIDNVDYESYIQKIYELIRTDGFQFYFEPNDSQKQIKNAQYKSLLIDFFQIMNEGQLNIDTVLSQYPVLNDVFTNFFRTVVMLASVTTQYDSYIDKNQLFDFLSSFFSVDISSYDRCLKFVQSDIFVYELDPQHIYMAFIKQQEQQPQQSYQAINSQNKAENQNLFLNQQNPKQSQKESQTNQNNHQNNVVSYNIHDRNTPNLPIIDNLSLKPRAKTIIKESYIEGQFADYTSFANISNFGKNVPAALETEISETVDLATTQSNKNNQSVTQQINDQEKLQNKERQLKRVLSTGDNITLKVNQISQTKEQHNAKQQGNKAFLKGNSHPNLLTAAKNNNRLVESFYQHNDSAINLQQNASSDKSDLQNSKHSQNSKHQKKNVYQVFEQPTKDPGFATQQQISGKYAQSTIVTNQIKQLTGSNSAMLTDFHKQKSVLSNDLSGKSDIKNTQSIKVRQSKQAVLKEPLFHKPQIPFPTLLSKNSLSQNGRFVSSSSSQKQPTLPDILANLNSKGSFSSLHSNKIVNISNEIKNFGFKTQNFKLNVTKQFTNSFVMKQMKQPYKSNVYQSRERARQFRKNIYQQIYYQGQQKYNFEKEQIDQKNNINLQKNDSNQVKPPSNFYNPSNVSCSVQQVKSGNMSSTNKINQGQFKSNPSMAIRSPQTIKIQKPAVSNIQSNNSQQNVVTSNGISQQNHIRKTVPQNSSQSYQPPQSSYLPPEQIIKMSHPSNLPPFHVPYQNIRNNYNINQGNSINAQIQPYQGQTRPSYHSPSYRGQTVTVSPYYHGQNATVPSYHGQTVTVNNNNQAIKRQIPNYIPYDKRK